jgi:hypothetical protein
VKVSQAKLPFIASPPHLSAERQVARADFPRAERKWASRRRRGNLPWRLATWRGEGGVICVLIPFDNGLSDLRPIQHGDGQLCAAPLLLDKIHLILTGNLWRALASLYSEARLYKGPRTATCPQPTILHSTGNISV